jgi:hypothetical protein
VLAVIAECLADARKARVDCLFAIVLCSVLRAEEMR